MTGGGALRAMPGAAAPAGLEQDAAPGPAAPGGARNDSGRAADTLDRLFARLKETTDPDEGEGIARRIEAQWGRSGSAVADLLAQRAVAASLTGDNALAVELIDRVTAIQPGWAEGWRRRGVLLSLLGDDERAALDLGKALALEPRDYQALEALGLIFYRNDDGPAALQAWRGALAINPHQPELQERVRKLALEVDGRDL